MNDLSPNTVDVTIVLPVRDEAPVLTRVLDEVCRVFGDLSLEIIVLVDTRSVDDSAELVKNYGERLRSGTASPVLRIIPLGPPQCGSGAARAIGSRESRGTLVGWIDADGTYAASDLRYLADTIGLADQVIGTRSRDFGYIGRLRFFVKWLVTKIAAWLWSRPDLVDLNSGLRVFRRASLLPWLGELPDGFSCTTTATLAALNHGQVVRFASISYFARSHETQSKFHPLLDTARLLRVLWRQWWRKPKKFPESGS